MAEERLIELAKKLANERKDIFEFFKELFMKMHQELIRQGQTKDEAVESIYFLIESGILEIKFK